MRCGAGAARKPDLTLVRSNGALPRQPAPAGSGAPIILFPEPETVAPPAPGFLGEEQLRWVSSLAIVLIVYGGILAWMVYAANSREVIAPPEGAMMIELAMEAGAPAPQSDAPPSPEPAEPTPIPPPEPKPEPVPEPEPEIPPVPEVPEPEVVTPPEPETPAEPEPEPEIQPVEQPVEEPETQDTPVEPTPTSASSAPVDSSLDTLDAGAPAAGASSVNAANQASPWRDLLLHRLEQAKRYPYQARRMRQEGVSHLRFTMDREGQVLSASIDQSSGHKLLDDEVLALIRRVQPLPKPPSDIPGDPVEVVVPVEFFLRR